MSVTADMSRFFAIAVIAAALYTYGLDRVPAFLTLDEAHFSVHAAKASGRLARVTLDDLAALVWREPWRPVVPGLEVELRNETVAGHPLFGEKAISVGRNHDTDDVLFLLLEHAEPLAVVHLTWRGRPDRTVNWPHTTFYSSLQEFVDRCMTPDHREFST